MPTLRAPTVTAALAFASCATLLPSGPLAAQERGSLHLGRDAAEAGAPIDLQRLPGSIEVDGDVEDAAWRSVDPLPLTMYAPTFRGDSDRRIELKAAYDDDAIYLAARFFLPPDEIRAFSLTRDRWSGDDGFGLLLDTFNDEENAVRFVGLPLGAKLDMSISGGGVQDRGAGGPRGISWNAFWDYETEVLDDGWSGEMRIPFSTLRFESGDDGSAVMGMMAYAYEPGTDSRWTFPAIPRTAQYTQVSAFQDVRIRDVAPRNPVYVTPYALGSSSRVATLNSGSDGWDHPSEGTGDVGLDLKINPTPNLTLDLTLNTDFAAVEADQQQVNLTRFSLFFDEKRPFFQERAGIFSFETGAERGTLFYSRRIGLADGVPVPIIGGARLVGRVGAWDIGLIDMQTDDFEGRSGENFGVLRLRRQLVNDYSWLGGMVTSRIGDSGRYNVTYGLDTQLRPFGDEYVTLRWLQTLKGGSEEFDRAPSGAEAGRVVVDWTRRRVEGLSYTNVFVWSGRGYDPGIGFESRTNFSRLQSDWSYQWYPGEGARWRRIWVGVETTGWRRNDGGEIETGLVQPFLQLETGEGATFRAQLDRRYESVEDAFSLSDDAEVPFGDYWMTEGMFMFMAPRGWWVRPNLTLRAGQFFDGSRVQLSPSVNWAINRHLELVGGWEFNRIRFEDRGQAFDANLLRLTARVAADTKLSVDVFGQYNSLDDQLTTNARLRYNFSEGRDLWLVWNEGVNLDRDALGVPRLPLSNARTLTAKYSHTLVF